MDVIKDIPSESFVYLDESGIDNNECYEYAWSPKGTRAHAEKRAFRSKRLSVIAVLNNKEIKAPLVFEGYCTTRLFVTYIEQVLLPTLTRGQTVIMDNASFHKDKKIKTLIESVGCKLIYLPAYSPDFNPIENCWFPLKNKIRKFLDRGIELYEAMKMVFNGSS